jgi:hypothetical protein
MQPGAGIAGAKAGKAETVDPDYARPRPPPAN